MENVEETKLRILREAIQSNVEGSRSTSKPRARLTLKRSLPVWLWGSLLIASFASLALPSLVVSRGKEASPKSTTEDTTKLPSPVAGQCAELQLSLYPPRLG